MKKSKVMAAALVAVMAGSMALAYAAQPVSPQGGTYSVQADQVEYDMKTGDGTLTGKTTIKHDGRVTVSQQGGTFNAKTKSGHLTGGVVSTKDDEKLVSRELIAHDGSYFSAIGGAVVTKGEHSLESDRLDYHNDTGYAETLGGYAHLSSTDGSWMEAAKITYDHNNGVANATGGVRLSSPPRNLSASGDTAVYETKNDGVIELIGNATATQDGNTVSGDRLKLNNTGKAKTSASGHVQIVYLPTSEEVRAAREKQAADEAAAKAAEAGEAVTEADVLAAPAPAEANEALTPVTSATAETSGTQARG